MFQETSHSGSAPGSPHTRGPCSRASASPARDALRQIVTFNKFHQEGGQAPAFFETVDRGDVRMI